MNIAYVISGTPRKKIYVSNMSFERKPVNISISNHLYSYTRETLTVIEIKPISYEQIADCEIEVGKKIILECIFGGDLNFNFDQMVNRVVIELTPCHADVRVGLYDLTDLTLYIESTDVAIIVNGERETAW